MTKKKLTDAIAATDTDTKMWKARFSVAKAAYDEAKFKECESLLHLALEQSRRLKEREFATNTCLVGLAAVYIAQEKHDEAKKQLEEAIRSLSPASAPALRELYGVALRFHAEVMVERKDVDTAKRELEQAIEVLEEVGVEGAVQLSYAISDLATIHVKQGNLKPARELILTAMDLLESGVGPEDPEYMRANMIYNICQAKDESEFLTEVEDSIVRMQYQKGHKHPSIAKALRWYLNKLHEGGDKERIAEVESKFGVKSKR